MRTTVLYFLLFISLFFFFSNCKKSEKEVLSASGTILNSGDIAADGCGWIIRIEGESYKPTIELPSQILVDGKSVQLKYTLKNSNYSCGMAGVGIKLIDIVSIQ